MFQYACNLCKYDMSFDIRDKSRLLEALILNNNCPTLKKNIISLLCSTKPPVMEPLPREDLLIGSLSHCVGMELLSHHILPDWSAQAFLMVFILQFNLYFTKFYNRAQVKDLIGVILKVQKNTQRNMRKMKKIVMILKMLLKGMI